jgi:hypothetical protein
VRESPASARTIAQQLPHTPLQSNVAIDPIRPPSVIRSIAIHRVHAKRVAMDLTELVRRAPDGRLDHLIGQYSNSVEIFRGIPLVAYMI